MLEISLFRLPVYLASMVFFQEKHYTIIRFVYHRARNETNLRRGASARPGSFTRSTTAGENPKK